MNDDTQNERSEFLAYIYAATPTMVTICEASGVHTLLTWIEFRKRLDFNDLCEDLIRNNEDLIDLVLLKMGAH